MNADVELIAHLRQVKGIALRASKGKPWHEQDDIISDAMLEALLLARSRDERSSLTARLNAALPLRLIDAHRRRHGRGQRPTETTGAEFDLLADDAALPLDELAVEADEIDRLLCPLPDHLRSIMRRWAYGERQCRIAKSIGVCESRVSQLVKESLVILQESHGAESQGTRQVAEHEARILDRG